ncbi:MAG: apolipoprotein N-acyltransferase, partial [Mycobacteriales bacterium]
APGIDAWLLLALAEAVLFALLGPGLTWAARLPAAPIWLAAVWVLDEAVRNRVPFGGFPWARLAFTQPDTPFTRLAAVGGAPLVSAAVALSGALLALALGTAARRRPGRAGLAALALGAAVLPGVAGFLVPVPSGAGDPVATVAVIQGNVPRAGYAAFRQKRVVLADHVRETLALAAAVRAGTLPAPDFVIWPENSSDVDPFTDPVAYRELAQAAAAIGRPILVGAVLDGPRPATVYNAGLIWGPHGPLGPIYIKRHPVPFGEYLPFRSVLSRLVGRFRTLLPNDFLPGHTPGLLTIAGTRISDVICFEVAYDSLVRQAVNAGGTLLVVQTNNATFGRTGESSQQLAMARLRAVEHGRTTVVASTSGISAIISPTGRLLASSGLFRPAILERQVPLITARTISDRLGALPEWILVGLGLVAVGAGVTRGVR